MNLVGNQGKGESVWLAFFLCDVLEEFAKVARLRGDVAFADRCEKEAMLLAQRIEYNAWDGEWYRRAYFDDGTPLGSGTNAECQIDSIAQSWSVLSGAGDVARSRKAMDAMYRRLVRRDHALVQLLDPPFDSAELDPGYIRGYVPGVRENGGQYTHAAIWASMAFAALGETAKAWELLGMINPLHHALTAEGTRTYVVEPYVIAADVYALAPTPVAAAGPGTGSAGWMYRLSWSRCWDSTSKRIASPGAASPGVEWLCHALPVSRNPVPIAVSRDEDAAKGIRKRSPSP